MHVKLHPHQNDPQDLNEKEFLILQDKVSYFLLTYEYRNKIINSISKLTNLNKDQINLKGKTVEKLGLIGKEKAIACETIISITKYD